MKYLGQFAIILAVSFAGEALRAIIDLPIPASIYGMVIMLLLLISKALPLKAVEETADFLVGIMPVMFIPAGVGLMVSFDALKGMFVPAVIAVLGVTVLVFAAAGWSAQGIIRYETRRRAGGRK